MDAKTKLNNILKKKNNKNIFETILDLDIAGYEFTKQDFDNILNYISNSKSKSLIFKMDGYGKIWDILFSKFLPDNNQTDKLLSCYNPEPFQVDWLDILIQKKYNFSDNQLEILQNLEFDIRPIFDYQIPTDNQIKYILAHIIKMVKYTREDIISLNFLKNRKNIPPDLLNYTLSLYDGFISSGLVSAILISAILDYNLPDNQTVDIIINQKITCSSLNLVLLKTGLLDKPELLEFYCQNFNHLKPVLDADWLILYFINKKIYPSLDGFNSILNTRINLLPDNPDGGINIYKILINSNLKPNLETLHAVITSGSAKPEFEDLLKNHNIIPIKKTILVALNQPSNYFLKRILSYKILPDYSPNICSKNPEKLKYLISAGFRVKLDMVELYLSKNQHIDNLEIFNINYDENLYFLCYLYDYFPESYISQFNNNIGEKIIDFRSRSLTDNIFQDTKIKIKKIINKLESTEISIKNITKYMESNKIEFDRYCLDNIIVANFNLGKYFIKNYNYEPSILTYFKIMAKKTSLNYINNFIPILKTSLEKYNINPEYMAEKITRRN